MAQQISESELILIHAAFPIRRKKVLESQKNRQDILSADELKEIESFWKKENE